MKDTLTGRLFLRIAPIVFLMLASVLALAFYSSRLEVNYVYDMQMVNDANVLWSLVEEELKEEGFKNVREIEHGNDAGEMPVWDADAEDYGSARMFRIWHGQKLVMRSDTAMPHDLPRQPQGFTNIVYEGIQWRIYSKPISNNITMEIGEKLALRNDLTRHILYDLFIPLLLVVPLIGLGLWFGIRSALSVIRTLVRQIHSRSPDDMSAITVADMPRDLLPLSKSINRLFDKLSQSIIAERMFADHAAHQLRTPLAGSLLLVQMLANADTNAERQTIVTSLENSIVRATALVNKLLITARISHQPVLLQPVPLYNAVADIMAEMGEIAALKGVELSLDGGKDAIVIAEETLLTLMVSNIIDNAIKYNCPHGIVDVRIRDEGNYWLLAVLDTGPGISVHEQELVFQRFYRSQVSQSEGTGLGLTIVADVIERFNGSISLSIPEQHAGLLVEIRLIKA